MYIWVNALIELRPVPNSCESAQNIVCAVFLAILLSFYNCSKRFWMHFLSIVIRFPISDFRCKLQKSNHCLSNSQEFQPAQIEKMLTVIYYAQTSQSFEQNETEVRFGPDLNYLHSCLLIKWMLKLFSALLIFLNLGILKDLD